MSQLAFFFPSSGPGGVQSIIIRLIKHAYVTGLSFIVLDYNGGYISSQIKGFNHDAFLKHVVIIDSFRECHFMTNYTFVAFNWQLSIAEYLERKFKTNFIYWDVHSISLDNILDLCLFGHRFKSQNSGRLLSVLADESRFLTIDLVSKKYIEDKSGSDKVTVTGIPISHLADATHFILPPPSNGIHIVYIARAVDWKVIPFYYCLQKVVREYSDFSIVCHVYTDNRDKFKQLLPVGSSVLGCELELFDGCSMDDIVSRERQQVNLSIGMGTSQFELLTYGVPTLLIPAVTDVDLLNRFDPLWTHMLPHYVYGFDQSTVDCFFSIELPPCVSLSNAKFSWLPDQLTDVKAKANLILDLYSSAKVSEILLYKSQDMDKTPSNAWKLKEFKIYHLWSSVVGFFKSKFQG